MPFIKPQDQIERKSQNIRFEKPILDDLQIYAAMTNSDEHYVVNEILRTVFKTDKEFRAFRDANPFAGQVQELPSAPTSIKRGRPKKDEAALEVSVA